MKLSGKVVKYGDDINTDYIIPGKYMVLTDPRELAKHVMEGIDPSFIKKSKDAIIVAGKNFGSGSSREQAPIALKHSGAKAIVAKSFARIFYRNAINIGLPVLECEDLWGMVQESDELMLDLKSGRITNLTNNKSTQAQPLPEFILELIEIGGLLNKLKRVKG
ncbi:MAG: 3-isopropylmalate dehydratase small subunit [archaeon]|nr:3-isopropylmalate dehydratase small subunit [archaeon]MCP8320998.1 3-isopropylmalate dehydratase small subunit [archaeon]